MDLGGSLEVDNHEAVKIGDVEKELGGDPGGQAQVQQRVLPERSKPSMGVR